MKALFSSLCLVWGLVGCASQSIVARGAESLDAETAAILKIDRTANPGGGLRPELNAVYPVDGEPLVRSESFKDYYKIKVAPGAYVVQLKVYSSGYQPAFPVIKVAVQPGKTYLFTSSAVMNGKAIRAEVREVATATDTTPEK